jgi:hypothetical protein
MQQGDGQCCIIRWFVICNFHWMLLWWWKYRKMMCATHVERVTSREMWTEFNLRTLSKKQTWRVSNSWEVIVKFVLKEIVCEDVDWSRVAQDRGQAVMNTAMKLPVPYNARHFLSSEATVSFSRRMVCGVTYLCKLHYPYVLYFHEAVLSLDWLTLICLSTRSFPGLLRTFFIPSQM